METFFSFDHLPLNFKILTMLMLVVVQRYYFTDSYTCLHIHVVAMLWKVLDCHWKGRVTWA